MYVAEVDRYSRLVFWLKIVLPLLALAILSTLFLVSRTIDPTQSIPYAEVDVNDLAETQRIGAPQFAGMTEDGTAIAFSARAVRPDGDGGKFAAIGPTAELDLPSGRSIRLTSAGGSLDRERQLATLEGGAVLESSDGYRVEADKVEARLDSTRVETAGAVTGTGPLGRIDAGKAVVVREPAGTYVLRFEGGVKLVYRPAKQGDPT
jgi:lipopolysaccharide export system protein LptC